MVEQDEALLLAVLNSAPVVDGRPTDRLAGESGRRLARDWGGSGDEVETAVLRRVRNALHIAVRQGVAPDVEELADVMEDVVRVPRLVSSGVEWELRVPAERRLAVDAILAWAEVSARLPGRLRPCANNECALFLIDHSRPGTAKWCSMATCGNRIKARTHARRQGS